MISVNRILESKLGRRRDYGLLKPPSVRKQRMANWVIRHRGWLPLSVRFWALTVRGRAEMAASASRFGLRPASLKTIRRTAAS